jgi:hypothetical protein
VEHVEENDKPCLYLVSSCSNEQHSVQRVPAMRAAICFAAAQSAAIISMLAMRGSRLRVANSRFVAQPKWSLVLTTLQVFEYLTTDLKKYMDRNGKGPNFPLPKTTIKV